MGGEVKQAVRSRYADAARQLAVVDSVGRVLEPGCCQPDGEECGCAGAYSADELTQVGLSDGISLGCGNPTLLADLSPGETVLDLGSGAGLDVLLSAKRVAPGGMAYGLDMTDEMLEVARANQARAGVTNATFLRGAIEEIPLPDSSVDVVISNCVINLSEDKLRVLRESIRVLRPGGRFAVADMLELEALSPEMKAQVDSWAGCISGTIPVADYRALLEQAGFKDVDIEVHATQEMPGGDGKVGSAYIRAVKP